MVSVDACKVLADATKIARHYAVVLPFLPKEIVFGYQDDMLTSFWMIARRWARNKSIVGGVKSYRDNYHKKIKKRLAAIQKEYIIFVPGASTDVSGKGYIGHDIYSMRNEFSNRLLQALAKEPQEYIEKLAVIPVSPVLQPTHFRQTETGLEAYNFFEDIVKKESTRLEKAGKTPFGSVTKSTADIGVGVLKPGFAQHDLMMYDSAMAKDSIDPKRREELNKILGPMTEEALDELIERTCIFNRHLAAMMFGKIIGELEFPRKDGKKQIDAAVSRSNPYFKILDMAIKYYATDAEFSYFSRTFMHGIERPCEREAESAAIQRIINRIRGRVVQKHENADVSDLL